MWVEEETFTAIPCWGNVPQRFKATFICEDLGGGLILSFRKPNSLVQLTFLTVLEREPTVADLALQDQAAVLSR